MDTGDELSKLNLKLSNSCFTGDYKLQPYNNCKNVFEPIFLLYCILI